VHEGGARWGAGIAALVVALAMQLGVNFANDYSDHVRGADTARVGPLRASSSGIVSPQQVRWAAIAAFSVAAIAGVGLSLVVDWGLLIAGAACLLAGWLYTGGPRPYGYLGLGELFVFVFFGLIATVGTVYVETGRVTTLAVLMGCGTGFLASAILVLNNLRDIDTDRAAGKHTLATRIGRERTRLLLLVLVCAAFAVPIVIFTTGLAAVTVMAMHFGIPIAAVPVRTAFGTTSAPALVQALKRMAMAELAYALLFTLGIML
jgi:1,4-dihydroxy-2-naphthoate octaprenyltransferase